MAKQSISARTANGWINDMDVTKSWIEIWDRNGRPSWTRWLSKCHRN